MEKRVVAALSCALLLWLSKAAQSAETKFPKASPHEIIKGIEGNGRYSNLKLSIGLTHELLRKEMKPIWQRKELFDLKRTDEVLRNDIQLIRSEEKRITLETNIGEQINMMSDMKNSYTELATRYIERNLVGADPNFLQQKLRALVAEAKSNPPGLAAAIDANPEVYPALVVGFLDDEIENFATRTRIHWDDFRSTKIRDTQIKLFEEAAFDDARQPVPEAIQKLDADEVRGRKIFKNLKYIEGLDNLVNLYADYTNHITETKSKLLQSLESVLPPDQLHSLSTGTHTFENNLRRLQANYEQLLGKMSYEATKIESASAKLRKVIGAKELLVRQHTAGNDFFQRRAIEHLQSLQGVLPENLMQVLYATSGDAHDLIYNLAQVRNTVVPDQPVYQLIDGMRTSLEEVRVHVENTVKNAESIVLQSLADVVPRNEIDLVTAELQVSDESRAIQNLDVIAKTFQDNLAGLQQLKDSIPSIIKQTNHLKEVRINFENVKGQSTDHYFKIINEGLAAMDMSPEFITKVYSLGKSHGVKEVHNSLLTIREGFHQRLTLQDLNSDLKALFRNPNVKNVAIADFQTLLLSLANDPKAQKDALVLRGFLEALKKNIITSSNSINDFTLHKILQNTPSVLKKRFNQAEILSKLDFDFFGHCLAFSSAWVAEKILGTELVDSMIKNLESIDRPTKIDAKKISKIANFFNDLYQNDVPYTYTKVKEIIQVLSDSSQNTPGFVFLPEGHATGLVYDATSQKFQYFDSNYAILEFGLSQAEDCLNYILKQQDWPDEASIRGVAVTRKDAAKLQIKALNFRTNLDKLPVKSSFFDVISDLPDHGVVPMDIDVGTTILATKDVMDHLHSAMRMSNLDDETVPLLHTAIIDSESSVDLQFYNSMTKQLSRIKIRSPKLVQGLKFLMKKTSKLNQLAKKTWKKYVSFVGRHQIFFSRTLTGSNVIGAIWQGVSFALTKDHYNSTAPVIRAMYVFTIMRLTLGVSDVIQDISKLVVQSKKFAENLIAKATSKVLDKVGLAFNVVGMAFSVVDFAFESISLADGLKSGNEVQVATSAVGITSSLVSLGFAGVGIKLAIAGSAAAASSVALVALPVTAVFIGFSFMVADFVSKREQSELAFENLGHVIKAYEQPLTLQDGCYVFHPYTVVSKIDFTNSKIHFGTTSIRKNDWHLLEAPYPVDGYLDLLYGFNIRKEKTFDTNYKSMVLPLTGTVFLDWKVHYTSTAFSAYGEWQMVRLRELYERTNGAFTFYNGMHTIFNITHRIDEKTVDLQLDGNERIFVMPEGSAYNIVTNENARQRYDLTYAFFGRGGFTAIVLNERSNGRNIVHIIDNSTSSAWVLMKHAKLSSVRIPYCTRAPCNFNIGDNIIVVKNFGLNNAIAVDFYDGVMYNVNFTLGVLVPIRVTKEWTANHKHNLERHLAALPGVQNSSRLVVEGAADLMDKKIQCNGYYVHKVKKILCGSSNGLLYEVKEISGRFTAVLYSIDLHLFKPATLERFMVDLKSLSENSAASITLVHSLWDLKGYASIENRFIVLKTSSNAQTFFFELGGMASLLEAPLSALRGSSFTLAAYVANLKELRLFSDCSFQSSDTLVINDDLNLTRQMRMWLLTNVNLLAFTTHPGKLVHLLRDEQPLLLDENAKQLVSIATVPLNEAFSRPLVDASRRILTEVGNVIKTVSTQLEFFAQTEFATFRVDSLDFAPLVSVSNSSRALEWMRTTSVPTADLVEVLDHDGLVAGLGHAKEIYWLPVKAKRHEWVFLGSRRRFLYLHHLSDNRVLKMAADGGEGRLLTRVVSAQRKDAVLIIGRMAEFKMEAIAELSAMDGVVRIVLLEDRLPAPFPFQERLFLAKHFVLALKDEANVTTSIFNTVCTDEVKNDSFHRCMTKNKIFLEVRCLV